MADLGLIAFSPSPPLPPLPHPHPTPKLSHTSDLKMGPPEIALPGARRDTVSPGTGKPGISILTGWDRLICKLYLSVKQSWNSKGPTGPAWPEQPRTECDGRGSLMAYAPPGVMGISKSISVWQHIQLSEQICFWDTPACCWEVKQPTNNNIPTLTFPLLPMEIAKDGGSSNSIFSALYAWWTKSKQISSLPWRLPMSISQISYSQYCLPYYDLYVCVWERERMCVLP